MLTISIDAADAAEVLTDFLERLNTHVVAWRLLLADCDPYGVEGLRADLTRLIKILQAT